MIAAPLTVDVRLTPDDDPVTPGVQVIKQDPSTNKTVTIIANVSNKNGWGDIANVTAEISGPGIVEDSPVNLSFDYAISVTTAVYTGSFNMSDHSEGDYKVEVTATEVGGFAGERYTYHPGRRGGGQVHGQRDHTLHRYLRLELGSH